jgi:hypothetical protein
LGNWIWKRASLWSSEGGGGPYVNGGGPGYAFKGTPPTTMENGPYANGGGSGVLFGHVPVPVTIVGQMPDDLAARRAQFEKMNPSSRLAPIEHTMPAGLATGMSSHAYEGRDPRSPSTGPYVYTPPPPPVVNVAAPSVSVSAPVVNVSVSVDGASVTAAVVTRIEKESRVATGVASHDGQASYRIPDQGGIRHQ